MTITMFLFILHTTSVIALTLRVLLRDDLSPTSRMAWFIVIFMLPIFGGILYFLFGEVDLGYSANKRYQLVFNKIKAYAGNLMKKGINIDKQIKPPYQEAFKYASSINGFNVVDGNSAELFPDAQTARSSLIEDIDAAKDHVHVLYYIWLNDATGTNTAYAIIRAAKRGVTCRVMTDGLGSRVMIKSKLWHEMHEAGVQVSVALPINNSILTILKSRLDLRNHRKITVIDGNITYCGSQNCADPEFAVKAKYAPWIDIMLRFKGPVAAQNQLLFASDWMQQNNTPIEDFPLIQTPIKNGFPALVMGDGPTERPGATPQLFASLIASAQSELIISTPYFVPDSTTLASITSAAYRGVKVTLIFPKINDSWVVAAASRSFYKKLLTANVSIYEHAGGLLHAKTLTIDGIVTIVGSSNMDLRSFDLNYENNIILQDKVITNKIYLRQLDYIKQSDKVSVEEVESWLIYKRIWNNVIATIGPVL